MLASFEEYLAQENALQVEQTNKRTQRIMSYVARLQTDNARLQHFVKAEMERIDDVETRSMQTKQLNRDLNEQLEQQKADGEAMKKDYESQLEEANRRLTDVENVLEEMETKYARIQEAMTLARRVHSRELEQVKKEKMESDEKYRKELEDLKKERDKAITAIGAADSLFGPFRGLVNNR
jgi:chromosome segregation ATPase